MAPETATSYDEVPYSDQCFPYTHPDHLATLAAVHGLQPPEVETCRVLEIGCAAGSNLIPMALTLPGATLVGIDLSPRQVESGMARVQSLGLENVALRAMSLTDIDASFGTFDFILCHGVYSWVPPAVREHILTICKANLAPDGVAYVSYNTLPGWHARGIVRELMQYHVRDKIRSLDAVRAARQFVEELAAVLPSPEGPYARIIRGQAERLGESDDSYVFHEYFEDVNEPCYVADFLGRAAARGLRFLAEARLGEPSEQFPPETREAVDRWAGDDPIAREQYVDFLCNGTFRRTLLVHDTGGPPPRASAGIVPRLFLSANARPVSERPDLAPDAPETFRVYDEDTSLTTGHAPLKTVLAVLHEARPRFLALGELWRAVRERMAPIQAIPAEPDPSLVEALLRCYRANLIGLHAYPARFSASPGDRPLGSPLARLQAEAGPRVTNLRQRYVVLGEYDRHLLRLLDGSRDRPAMLARLEELCADGSVTIEGEGGRITDPETVREILDEALEPALQRLARVALLMPSS
jgi:methyltransferase-like protein/SAM-dependent methyltransferase